MGPRQPIPTTVCPLLGSVDSIKKGVASFLSFVEVTAESSAVRSAAVSEVAEVATELPSVPAAASDEVGEVAAWSSASRAAVATNSTTCLLADVLSR